MNKLYSVVDGPASVQGSKEWLEMRFDHGTASEAPVILLQSPYKTPLQLAEEKIARKIPETSNEQRVLFERGHAAERAGREFFKQKLGLDLTPRVLVSTKTPDLLASLDGFNEEKKVIFEAKFVGRDALHELKTKKKVPAHHESQMQAQLYVTGADKCMYFATDPEGNSAVMDVLPQTEYAQDIADQIVKFMDMVRAGELPEPTEKDFIELDDLSFLELFQRKIKMDLAKKEFEAMKEELLAKYENHRRIRAHGLQVIRSTRKGNVQYAKIPQLKGLDLEKYRAKPSEVVTVSLEKKVKNENVN